MTKPRVSPPRFVLALVLLASLAPALGGELKKPYFTATKHGAWADCLLTSPDGSKSSFLYERQVDDDGRVVITMQCKILAGPGKDTKVRNTYIQPRNFNLDRDGLSYGKFTEKMIMNYSGAELPVDEKTLAVIREGSKDFGGALTFEATEKIGGHSCDRYAYSVRTGGPGPTLETGKLWLDPSVPFAIVRQTAKVTKEDGTLVTEFEMKLEDTGLNQLIAENAAAAAATPPPKAPEKPAAPSKVSLAEGFKAGRVGIDIEVVPGSSGSSLRLTLVNKTDTELTVTAPAGEQQFEVDSPVNILKISLPKAADVVVPASDKSEPLVVGQRGARGVAKGYCSLSVYEGTPLFSGSVTMGSLPK